MFFFNIHSLIFFKNEFCFALQLRNVTGTFMVLLDYELRAKGKVVRMSRDSHFYL